MGWKEAIEYWKSSPVERRKLTIARRKADGS